MHSDHPAPDLTIFAVNYAPEPSGNAPYTTGLAEHLAHHGWSVDVITGYPHYPAWKRGPARRREMRNGVAIERHRHTVPRVANAAQRGLFEITWLAASLPSALRKRDADVVVGVVPNLSGAVLAQIAALRNRVPSVLWFQDLMGPAAVQSGTTGGGRVAGLVSRIEGALAKRADRILVAAEGFRPYLAAAGVSPRRITQARNWNLLPPSTLDRTAARSALGIEHEAIVAVHSGNMGAKQGLEVVVGTASREPGILFILQGDGIERGMLEAEVERRGLENVWFMPTLPGGELSNLLAAADALLVTQRPTVTDMSLPSKLASYLASGAPVVASVDARSETAAELASQGVGVVVEPGDAAALAAGLHRAIGRPPAPPPSTGAGSPIDPIRHHLEAARGGPPTASISHRPRFDASKSILVLAPHLLLPAHNGADILVEQSARHLSTHVPSVTVIGAAVDIEYVDGERTEIRPADRTMRSKPVAALRTIGTRSHYYREKFLTPAFRDAADEALSSGRYGGVICSYLTTVEIAAKTELPIAAWTHNDEFRWFSDLRDSATDLVRKSAAESSLAYLHQHARELAADVRLAHVSREDLDGFSAVVGAHDGAVVPIGADTDVPVAPPRDPQSGPPVLLFVGSLGVGMNADALHHFESRFVPGLTQSLPGLRVVVAGSTPTAAVETLCRRNRWELHPDVSSETLDALYDQATFAFLPFAYATGSKLKLLAALAHGVPVLATEAVVAGADSFASPSVRSDDPERWVEAIADGIESGITLESRQDLRRIAEGSSWEASTRDLMRFLIEQRTAVPSSAAAPPR